MAVEKGAAVTKILGCGVEHRDVRPPNVLWNPESDQIGFDWALAAPVIET